jgi:thiol reductant ABC exporter CydD subunit
VRPLDPRLLRHARSTRWYLALTVGLGAATAVLVIVQATLLARIITGAFLEGADLAALEQPIGVLLGVVVARAALAWVQESAAQRASGSVKSELRVALLTHVIQLGPVWRSGQRSGDLVTLAVRGIDALDGYFAKYLPQLVLAVVVPTAILARIVTEDLLATVTIIVTLPLIPVFMVLVGQLTQARTRRQWRALEQLGSHFLDVVAGLPTLKVFGRAKAQAEQVRQVSDEHRRATMGTLRIAFLSALVLELLATLSVALVAVGVGLRIVEGDLDLETGLLVLILAPEAYLPLRMVGVHFHASAEGLAAAERVFAVLETPSRAGTQGRSPAVPATLELDRVTLAYGDGPAVVEDLSFRIRCGEVVALAGPSGTGKSTVVLAILGLLAPSAGRVLVGADDGTQTDLAEVDLPSWRRHVGWCPQRPHLPAGTLGAALRQAAPVADEDAMLAALAEVALLDGALGPSPLGRVVGDEGSGLSAGQRRRVAVARALLREAPLLVLDEPTADLDLPTEAHVLAALRRRAEAGAAVLVVAHRPSVLAWADRIVTVPTPEPAALP